MGVDFVLYRRKRRKAPKSDISLPEIEARFAATEYPRFLSQLAKDAGIGDVWERYQEAGSHLSMALVKRASVNFDPERPFGPNKKERRRANRKKKTEGREGQQLPEADHGIESLTRQVEETRRAIEELSPEEPLIEFLLARTDCGEFDSQACQRIGPRIRSIVEEWELAPRGWVGWRERALEIADAMEIAAKHPDVVFGISG